MFALFTKIQSLVGWFDAHRRAERLLGGSISVMLACIVVFLLTTWKSDSKAEMHLLEVRFDEKLALTLKATAAEVSALAREISKYEQTLDRLIKTNEQILKKMAGIEMKVSDAKAPEDGRVADNGILTTKENY